MWDDKPSVRCGDRRALENSSNMKNETQCHKVPPMTDLSTGGLTNTLTHQSLSLTLTLTSH